MPQLLPFFGEFFTAAPTSLFFPSQKSLINWEILKLLVAEVSSWKWNFEKYVTAWIKKGCIVA